MSWRDVVGVTGGAVAQVWLVKSRGHRGGRGSRD